MRVASWSLYHENPYLVINNFLAKCVVNCASCTVIREFIFIFYRVLTGFRLFYLEPRFGRALVPLSSIYCKWWSLEMSYLYGALTSRRFLPYTVHLSLGSLTVHGHMNWYHFSWNSVKFEVYCNEYRRLRQILKRALNRGLVKWS